MLNLRTLLFGTFLLGFCLTCVGQGMYLPSNSEISSAPSWAQLMYAANPNVFEIDHAYKTYYRKHDFEKSFHTQYYKRWRRSIDNQINPDGYVAILSPEEKIKQHNLFLEKSTNAKAAGNAWSVMGPIQIYNENGGYEAEQTNVYAIHQAPSQPSTLYCGTEPGEIYKSTDAGINWTNASLGYRLDGGVSAIHIHPTDPNIVYAGSGDFLYRTLDAGATWTDVFSTSSFGANEILINPTNTQIITVASNQGLVQSIDGGSTWNYIFNEKCYDIKLKTDDDAVMFLVKNNPFLIKSEFYKSVDYGVTFTLQDAGWYDSTDPDRADGGCRLAVSDADPNRVYAYLIGAAKTDDWGFIGVYRSDDAGVNWTLPNGPDGGPYTPNHHNLAYGYPAWTYNQGFYNCAIMASNTNADHILVGGLNLWQSLDGGNDFDSLAGYVGGTYNIHVDMQDFRNFGNHTWITTDGGIYYSPDFFATDSTFEVRMNGVHGADFWGFGTGWNEDIMIGGLYHNGNASWFENYGDGNFLGLGGGEPASGYVNQGENRKVFSSDINGKIMPLQIGDPITSTGFGIDPNESYWAVESSEFEFDPRCYNIGFTGKDHQLWKTVDGGTSFSLAFSFGNNTDDIVTYIEISRSNPDVMYVAQQPNVGSIAQLWRTNDGGNTFNFIGLPAAGNTKQMLIQVDPSDENTLYVAFRWGSNGNKVFRTSDGGTTWDNLSGSLLNGESVQSLVYIAGTDGGLYVGTRGAMYYRNNSMSDWDLCNTNLPIYTDVNIVRPFYRDGKIRMASYGKGVWEVDMEEEPSAPIAQICVDKLEYTMHCDTDTFHYVDLSIVNHNGASWYWEFEGGTPSTSTALMPNVHYNTPGTYLTLLTITDASGNSSTDSLYIEINAYSPLLSVSEDFETFFPQPYMEIINVDNDITWEQETSFGAWESSSSCMKVRNFDYYPGGALDDLRMSFDLSASDTAYLSFDVAYAKYAVNYSDSLELLVSLDCGATFTSVYFKGGDDLATAPDFVDSYFLPANNEWRTDSISLGEFLGNDDVMVVFRNHTGWGQNIYIDNINLSNSINAIRNQQPETYYAIAFPNPISSAGRIKFKTNVAGPYSLQLFSLDGKLVGSARSNSPELEYDNLDCGIYLVRFEGDEFINYNRIIVQ